MSVIHEISIVVLTAIPLQAIVRRGSIRSLFAILVLASAAFVQQAALLPSQAHSAPPVQQGSAAQADRITRPTSEPYKGDLSIFESPGREERLQINRVMDVLGIKEGAGVADIGAGSGWFTVKAARRVGASGTVYAVEINPGYLKHIEQRAKMEHLPGIRTVLGKEDDPMLPPECVDAVMILKTYHEIAQPVRLLIRLRDAMRPGGLLGIIDRNGNGSDHGLDSKIVIGEARRAGFRLISQYDFVKGDGMDYFLVFQFQPEVH